jgi:hypothetical protein
VVKQSEKLRKQKARDYHYRKTYGITYETFLEILQEQGKSCFVCGRKLKLSGKNTRSTANLDHCHTTGRIRGILCRRCNMDLIPFFEKDLEQAKRLHEYLTRKTNYGFVPS